MLAASGVGPSAFQAPLGDMGTHEVKRPVQDVEQDVSGHMFVSLFASVTTLRCNSNLPARSLAT